MGMRNPDVTHGAEAEQQRIQSQNQIFFCYLRRKNKLQPLFMDRVLDRNSHDFARTAFAGTVFMNAVLVEKGFLKCTFLQVEPISQSQLTMEKICRHSLHRQRFLLAMIQCSQAHSIFTDFTGTFFADTLAQLSQAQIFSFTISMGAD